jgi:hypothetical protein
MIWALLALLGVPIWLIVSALGGVFWSRRSFRQMPGVFKVATRDAGATGWKRTATGHARCISNVLVINVGLALIRTRIHEVRQVEAVDLDASPRGFDTPHARRLLLDDGSAIEVAAEADQIAELDSLTTRTG